MLQAFSIKNILIFCEVNFPLLLVFLVIYFQRKNCIIFKGDSKDNTGYLTGKTFSLLIF